MTCLIPAISSFKRHRTTTTSSKQPNSVLSATMKSSIVFATLTALLTLDSSLAFSLLQPSCLTSLRNSSRRQLLSAASTTRTATSTTQIRSSKNDEIAALEEKLRQLKEETEQATVEVVTVEKPIAATEDEDENENELKWKPVVRKVPIRKVVEENFSEMLSESWKEGGSSVDESGTTKNLIAAGLLIVAAIAFAFVPVGQEGLDKYSTPKTSTSIDLG